MSRPSSDFTTRTLSGTFITPTGASNASKCNVDQYAKNGLSRLREHFLFLVRSGDAKVLSLPWVDCTFSVISDHFFCLLSQHQSTPRLHPSKFKLNFAQALLRPVRNEGRKPRFYWVFHIISYLLYTLYLVSIPFL